MSVLSLIDNSKTKHEVIKGVHWWSNPELSVKINSKGEVYSPKGKKVGGCKQKSNYSPTYSVNIKQGKNIIRKVVTFQGLFCYLALNIESTAATKLVKKDCLKGYTVDNVILLKTNNTKGTGVVVFDADLAELNDQQPTKLVPENTETPKFYKVTQGNVTYTTEDGAKFPTRELAEWHQEKVTKGKVTAQIALDYNGGYVMAEQLFLNEVVYNCAKPYEHFKDVLENDQGVQEIAGEGDYELDFDAWICVGASSVLCVDRDADFKCTKEEALIAEKLLVTIDDKFMDMLKEVNKFKALFPNLIQKDNI